MSVELGWYQSIESDFLFEVISDSEYVDWDDGYHHINSRDTVLCFANKDKYRKVFIAPGDVVKPKPAGDKCWDTEWDCLKWKDDIEGIVGHIRDCTVSGMPTAFFGGKRENLPISCLILLEKGAKDKARDFQVGDEVEYASHCALAGQRRMISGFGERGLIHLDRMSGGHCGMAEKSNLKLIRRAGEKAVMPGQTAAHDERLITHITQKPLNPRVLPSHSGSELLWPDVKAGIELDKLPMDKHTTEDELVARDSDYQVCRMGDALGCIENIELGIVNNSDRERIRKIIPEIERKLTQLKGRL